MFKKPQQSPQANPETQNAMRAHWPLIQNLFKDIVGEFAAQALANDAQMQIASALVYKLLPVAARAVIPERIFVALCLKGRDNLLAPLLAAQDAKDHKPLRRGPQSLAEQLEWKSRQIEAQCEPESPATPSSRVAFSVRSGPLAGKSWSFDSHDTCLIGRHEECAIQLPNDEAHRTVSRHHALIEIAPPLARIRDFGSLNGTFLNGDKIGAREAGMNLDSAAAMVFPERELRGGDQIRVGDTLLWVGVQNVAPPATPLPAQPRVAPQPQAKPQEKTPAPSAPLRGSGKMSDYKIEGELGRGGMGQVFLARRRSTGERVALKVMLPRVAVDERSKAIFEREIALTRSLSHENVVSMLDFGTDGDKFFFTLDFCEHGSVMDWMEKSDAFPSASQAVAITLQVLDGLDYLARVPLKVQLQDGTEQLATGLVHRDLSPQNILLKDTSHGMCAKISDVGLGKAFDTAGLSGLTMTGAGTSGKPVFMPRQQVINFKFAKPEVDVWAAAATLYFLLTAKFPRDFPPRTDPFKVVLSSDPIPIRRRDPQVPAPLAEVIDRALKDKPALFYKNARDLSADLIGALQKMGMNA